MDFTPFDRRGYPVVPVVAGYAEWANTYDATVTTGLDRPLLNSLTSVNWQQVRVAAANLGCGTGRTGLWHLFLASEQTRWITGKRIYVGCWNGI
jgi:hypothetical protein